MTIRAATLNVNGFGTLQQDHPKNKWGRIAQLMNDKRIGILMIQESHLSSERLESVQRLYEKSLKIFSSAHPSAPGQKEGVAILINKRMVSSEGATATAIVEGRALHVTLKCAGDDRLHVLCIYAPTSDGVEERCRFFNEVRSFYERHREFPKPDIMAGDFNNVEDAIDRLPINESPDRSVEDLDKLKLSLQLMLTDGWRETHPTDRGYTFHRGRDNNATLSRLDRMYTREAVFRLARDWIIMESGIKTDHRMMTVQLTTATAPSVGHGRPIFPLSIIKDRKLAKAMKDRGMVTMSHLDKIERGIAPRSECNNPQRLLADMKNDWMKMARDREKEVVPKLLAEI
ncbi:DNase I-like protein, partial [Dichomitus squalens LYAD-421 SS1]